MCEIAQSIEHLLSVPPFGLSPEEHEAALLGLLKKELESACARNARYRNYVQHWPIPVCAAEKIADLPYLPVALLKAQLPLSLVEHREIKRVLVSSSTTGQVPSRVALDLPTARRMTKGIVTIIRNFLGSERRPYLVVDVPGSVSGGAELGARGAAIQSLQPFASTSTFCLSTDTGGNLMLDRDQLSKFAKSVNRSPVLVFGFTHILWRYLIKPLMAEGVILGMPEVHVLHSGGWKLLQAEAVDKKSFNDCVARVFGCSPDRVVDFYGMVENVGVIYPDCPEGNKHAPAFADVLIRNPLTLAPVHEGETGIVQVCSALPTSFPGNLLLTDDISQFVARDGCRCGRRGICFRFVGRVARAEVRGCGNIERKRQRAA